MSLQRLTEPSGILELMDDLGQALTINRDAIMMGGGNPAQIPAMQEIWREQTQQLLADEARFGDVLANYDPPVGNPAFLEAMAAFLKRHCGWNVTAKNLAITTGGQTAFFYLMNLFSDNGKKILLPLMPEYIGYASQGLREDIFATQPARIERTGPNRFKYRIDFDALEVGDDIGAICVSRPTNPSANVLTDNEIRKLAVLAEERGIPLIIDNAYGLPFPGVIFVDAKPFWNENVIQTLSLSKLGLPGTRTGIVVANEDLIAKISAINASVGLANNNIGQALARTLVESDRLSALTQEVIRPFYVERCQAAASALDQQLQGVPYALHEPEGAFFLWLWLEDLPITSRDLYLRLKERGVLVVSGEYFFFGLNEDWPHSRQCLRLSYTQPRERVERGIEIIADEVKRIYAA
ncbi:MAG: valine--pyruvate transaminase [Verrucomicrobiota bacterium]